MPDYRLLYADLVTGTVYGELPAMNVSATTSLNAAGRLSATVPLVLDPPDLVTAEELAVARTAVTLERDLVPVWSGILWGAGADLQAQTMSITCEGYHSYYKRRIYVNYQEDLINEQQYIAKALIDHANLTPSRNIGVHTDFPANPGTVVREFHNDYWNYVSMGEAIESVAFNHDGFDFAYVTDRDPATGAFRTYFRPLYPDQGRVTAHVFEVGTNCAVLTYDEDGTQMVDQVGAYGAGEGRDRIVAYAINNPMLDTYPLLVDILNYSSITTPAELLDKAQRRLSRGAGPARRVSLATFPDTEPTLGSYSVGDQVRVIASVGWVQVNDMFRIVELTLDVADGGETVTMSLLGLESFAPV